MNSGPHIAAHCNRPGLLEGLSAARREDGADPSHLQIEALAPYDQFHGPGLEATLELARSHP